MKRFRVIGMVVAIVGLLVVSLAGTALAHNPDDGETGTSSGVYLDQPTLTRVAQTLGLTQDELLTRLQGGETISAIAADQNVPEDEVVEAIIAPYRDELQLQVKYGYISQGQADALEELAKGWGPNREHESGRRVPGQGGPQLCPPMYSIRVLRTQGGP